MILDALIGKMFVRKTLLYMFLSMFIFSCKRKSTLERFENKINFQEKITNVLLDQVNQFEEINERNEFVTDNYLLKYDYVKNLFLIKKNNETIDLVDFDDKDFDGVGYNAFYMNLKKVLLK